MLNDWVHVTEYEVVAIFSTSRIFIERFESRQRLLCVAGKHNIMMLITMALAEYVTKEAREYSPGVRRSTELHGRNLQS